MSVRKQEVRTGKPQGSRLRHGSHQGDSSENRGKAERENCSLSEKAEQLGLSVLRSIDVARDLLRRAKAVESEVQEFLDELERGR